jgi:hypothetical protein
MLSAIARSDGSDVLHLARGVDQQIGGLQIPVDHADAMSVDDRVADAHDEPQSFLDAQPVVIGVARDGNTFHIFHGEVRLAILGETAVQQARDVGVLEAGQDLPLAKAPAEHVIGGHPATDQLERHPPVELPVRTLREVDRAHPSVAQLPQHAIRPDSLPALRSRRYARVRCTVPHRPQLCGDRGLEKAAGLRVRRQQRLQSRAELRIARAGAVEAGGALPDRKLERRVQDRLDPLPELGRQRSLPILALRHAGPARPPA